MSNAEVTKIAEYLLRIKAVRLQPDAPFTWASGLKSPVYCDNRLSLSFPELRGLVRDGLIGLVRERFPQAAGIAGVATAGIPQAAMVADHLALPLVYIRSKPKGHGLSNQIEGQVDPEGGYVVIEDLVSTGGSSLKAVEALREAGGKVLGVLCVFSYGFTSAEAAFREAGLPLFSILDLNILLQKAVEIEYIQPRELEIIRGWRQDPAKWSETFTLSQSH